MISFRFLKINDRFLRKYNLKVLMIKKNTKIVFEDEKNKKFGNLEGGIPLSKGEVIHFHEGSKVVVYEVKNKGIDCFFEGEDQVVNITYTLKKIRNS